MLTVERYQYTILHESGVVYRTEQSFEGLITPEMEPFHLLRILGQYAAWNAVFAGCVAKLAGRIANDKAYRLRGSIGNFLVAAKVFFAAISEFGEIPHRLLAQRLIDAVANYYKLEEDDIRYALRPSPHTHASIKEVKRGYSRGKDSSFKSFAQTLGFHIGSELLTAQEFQLLDRRLRATFPDLVQSLEAKESYSWIQVHATVDAEHAAAAIEAANLAIEYGPGWTHRHLNDLNEQLFFQGFEMFCRVRMDFISGLHCP